MVKARKTGSVLCGRLFLESDWYVYRSQGQGSNISEGSFELITTVEKCSVKENSAKEH